MRRPLLGMRMNRVSLPILAFMVLSGVSGAAELKPETLRAWDDYVRAAELRAEARAVPGGHFLWSDEDPDRAARLLRGEVLTAPMVGSGALAVPNGLIHHWVGAEFLPNATIESVLGVVHDYDHYRDYYKPVVVDSKLLGCADGGHEFSMRWVNKVLFVTAAIDGEYESRDIRVDEKRLYTFSRTTGVREIADYGKPTERRLQPGQGNGYIWRLSSIARYEERNGGVYVELEAMALTRDIPASLRWLATPVVTRLSRNSLVTSLEQTRDATHLLAARAAGASCPMNRPLSASLLSSGN